MLQKSKVFSSYSVKNMLEAKAFYTDILGLSVKEDEMGVLGIHFEDENEVMIYPKDNHEPATFTVLNFKVKNIESVVDELTVKGVIFEQYDSEYIKTDEKGISKGNGGPTIAWFKDPAGNFLSVIEE